MQLFAEESRDTRVGSAGPHTIYYCCFASAHSASSGRSSRVWLVAATRWLLTRVSAGRWGWLGAMQRGAAWRSIVELALSHGTTQHFSSLLLLLLIFRSVFPSPPAYEFLNNELANTGLEIRTPETIRDVSKSEVPIWVRKQKSKQLCSCSLLRTGLPSVAFSGTCQSCPPDVRPCSFFADRPFSPFFPVPFTCVVRSLLVFFLFFVFSFCTYSRSRAWAVTRSSKFPTAMLGRVGGQLTAPSTTRAAECSR